MHSFLFSFSRMRARLLLCAALTLSPLLGFAQLVNLSVNAQIGSSTFVVGFVITGDSPRSIMVRAVGPGLIQFGVPNVNANPMLTLYQGPNVIGQNDDWDDNANEAAALTAAASVSGAFALSANSPDAALVTTLSPGAYTVAVNGSQGAIGQALIEVYEIPYVVSAQTGVVRGAIRDGLSGELLPNTTVTFFGSANSPIASTVTDAAGEYSVTLNAGTALATISRAGYASTSMTAEVAANSTVQVDTILFAPNRAGNGTVSGAITNALNGQNLSGATLTFRAGVGATSGAALATTTTAFDGSFSVALPSGTYTCEVLASGFVTARFVCAAVGGENIAQQNFSASPVLAENEVRVVLTWGSAPSDLDSHLTGPANGTSRFHIYYASRGSLTGLPNAALDVDDTSSFGPETITLTARRAGTYRYSVHNFSALSSTTSTVMSNNSDALVRVFAGSGEVGRFRVPTGQVGNLWTVFEMDGTTGLITPVNTLSNQSSPGAVTSHATDSTDAALMRDLPPKVPHNN
ncbi:carboxypeptidase regulatory-like domain-containing protein [Synoicihabitans lomoniglobus]|uniref:Carboxypeptidase regulatory-like domain-containing protein n=1 Tax=Synoicihabitans lomoniglobus TaxID=2909285 RepID=A0AAE9ZV05_9BACT|nr:carboxypeptidase regulatory-like domain-containing protein [Opitutaceae bacterium LMO-M01]WED64602.1 carboxypeptidase regulatory-like domain-containing protein [Opitutaceae bacterium LMO-M01]